MALWAYLGLSWYVWTGLVPGAGGLLPFDLRVTGYSAEDVTAYLAALTPDASFLYRGRVAAMDTIFPIAFALWIASLGFNGWRIARIGAVLALVYGGVDLLENATVARLLTTPMLVDPGLAARASLLTISKFAVLVVAAGFVLLGRRRT